MDNLSRSVSPTFSLQHDIMIATRKLWDIHTLDLGVHLPLILHWFYWMECNILAYDNCTQVYCLNIVYSFYLPGICRRVSFKCRYCKGQNENCNAMQTCRGLRVTNYFSLCFISLLFSKYLTMKVSSWDKYFCLK